MIRDRRFERWWTEEGRGFVANGSARTAAEIAWSNGSYLASCGVPAVDYRSMKKTPPDRPGLWACRAPGATWSTNVAVTRGGSALFIHHPNGSVYSIHRWAELYPKMRWKEIS